MIRGTPIKLSQAAPTVPVKNAPLPEKVSPGIVQPVSSPSIPSVYNKKIGNLFRGRLVVLPHDTTIRDALIRLAHFNVSSAPVTKKDNTTGETWLLGFVDMIDFLTCLLKLSGKEWKEGEPFTLSKEEQQGLLDRMKDFNNMFVENAVNISGCNPFNIMHQDSSLAEAVNTYLKNGVHRIAVTDDNGEVVGVVSQWTIANYLDTVPTEDKDWIPELKMTVDAFPHTRPVVKYVDRNTPTLNAFLEMFNNKLCAIGLVDDNGCLCGNLSASDLKNLNLFFKDFASLSQPVGEFVANIRNFQNRAADFCATCSPKTQMRDVIKLCNKEIVHRVYIVDNDRKPLGVLSLTDILKDIVVDTHTIPAYAQPNIPRPSPVVSQ